MEVTVIEWVEDDEGGHFEEHKEERDYSATEDRHDPICVVCGFPSYPECMSWCQNKEWRRERLEKERLEKEKKAG
ncbi:MAG: hypothetical protein LIO53_00245 [Oscillospiraceae bacterium]|nr:hypothetical protein [Oscillospiraceae bacterium]